jgi:ACT domain-containing protein
MKKKILTYIKNKNCKLKNMDERVEEEVSRIIKNLQSQGDSLSTVRTNIAQQKENILQTHQKIQENIKLLNNKIKELKQKTEEKDQQIQKLLETGETNERLTLLQQERERLKRKIN